MKETTRGVFHRRVYERVKELWNGGGSVEEKWESVKSGLCETAESVLGYETRRQPDWLRESEADLKPLLERRTRLYTLWLSTARERDRKKFAKACSDARRAVWGAKEDWFQRKALEA